MPAVTAVVIANGLDEIEHAVIPPAVAGGAHQVYVHGVGHVAVGWHPVLMAYIAMLSVDQGEGVEPEVTRLPVQDHPDGSVEVRLIGNLGDTIGLALWVWNLPRHPAWYCQCGEAYPTLDFEPCTVCGRTTRLLLEPEAR